MNLSERIQLLAELGMYLSEDTPDIQKVRNEAYERNNWFTEEFTALAIQNIVKQMLQKDQLQQWAGHYSLDDNITSKTVGIVMAGNIPLVGFHDFLSAFICGHRQVIKLSEKDEVLLPFLISKLAEWNSEVSDYVSTAYLLKGCDAYIATGSNNSSRYFEYYFSKYPSVIRRNKTSVAILTGDETPEELELLANDIHFYFGLGCRNVTKIFAPVGYNFIPLLDALKKFQYFTEHHKYKNNYDYNLALLIMNNKKYMTNGSIILVENEPVFTPVSQVHYTFYEKKDVLLAELSGDNNIQCISGRKLTEFGQAQKPGLFDYADGVDVMEFLLSL
jgi:Acyl-CoA reductase (LuxC)